jgi:hypothetical protein
MSANSDNNIFYDRMHFLFLFQSSKSVKNIYNWLKDLKLLKETLEQNTWVIDKWNWC